MDFQKQCEVNMLIFPLKKQWYEKIKSGEKTIEYREVKDYWTKRFLKEARNYLPDTTFQLLSNGRGFKDREYTHNIAQAAGENFFVGIPLHSDYLKDHDAIAGCKHAFEETMLGLYNLASEDAEIELRVVVNAMNYRRLPQIAEFIFKNLPFVSWVALWGWKKSAIR